jgi:hypothetical protein
VDEAASPARAPRDRSGGLQADPSDGEGEPPVGLHEDQRRAGKARDPRVRHEHRAASSPLRRRSGPSPRPDLAPVPEGSGSGHPGVRFLHRRDGVSGRRSMSCSSSRSGHGACTSRSPRPTPTAPSSPSRRGTS